ncbi:hypothetical protein QBC39DRAFT_425078 [Podospora conica]|nr:hypothetical protein QBC39DRAFT_425078 [Schizothecium conicum]
MNSTLQKPYEIFIPLPSLGDTDNSIRRTNLAFKIKRVSVQDVRGSAFELVLFNSHVFQFVRHKTSATELINPDEVMTRYIPEMQELLDTLIHTSEPEGTVIGCHCFDVRVRNQQLLAVPFSTFHPQSDPRAIQFADPIHPHIDQSPGAAIRRVKQHLPDEAEELLKGRVRIINIWRPIRKVRAWPLAVCDATTLEPGDLVACDIVRRRFIGETLFGTFNPHHKWYYLSDQDVDEITVLQVYDSAAVGDSIKSE